MISAEKARQIERLLREGSMSQRQIARHTGVSRGTVGAIAHGRRRLRRPSRKRPDDPVPQPDGAAERCATCGAMVQMPCLACYVRGILAAELRRGRRRIDGRWFSGEENGEHRPAPVAGIRSRWEMPAA